MSQASSQAKPVVYPKPKIALIDCVPEAAELLISRGYNALAGSFGRRYRVKREGRFVPVEFKPDLPNYQEQEIVVIDLSGDEPTENPAVQAKGLSGVKQFWASANTGVVDPRPIVMAHASKAFDQILRHGGVFIVFCQPRTRYDLCLGEGDSYGHFVNHPKQLNYDNFSFLTVLNEQAIEFDASSGDEIRLEDSTGPLKHFLNQHLDGASYTSLLRPDWSLRNGQEYQFFLC